MLHQVKRIQTHSISSQDSSSKSPAGDMTNADMDDLLELLTDKGGKYTQYHFIISKIMVFMEKKKSNKTLNKNASPAFVAKVAH